MRAVARLVLGLLTGLATAAATPGMAAESVEYAVKAAYLYKVADFVDWPAAAFPAPGTPITLCVVGPDPFGPVLDQAVQAQHVGGRDIVIRRLPSAGPTSGCHILFAGNAPEPQIAETLAAVRGSGVLTFTDGATAADATGIVNFVVQDNRVRFAVDDEAAALNGLTISSKLLRLALSVNPRK